MRGGCWSARASALVLAGWLAACGGSEVPGAGDPVPPGVEVPPAERPTDGAAKPGSIGFLRQYDEAGRERPEGAASGADGSFVVLGVQVRQHDTGEPGVVREEYRSLVDHYDREGNLLWTLELPEGVRASAVAVGTERILVAGGYCRTPQLAGTTLPEAKVGRGLFLLTLSLAGAPLSVQSWVVGVGRAQPRDTEAYVTHLRADASGSAVLVGRYRGALDLGAGELPQEDPRIRVDATFVARFAPGGQLLWARSLGTTVAVRTVAAGASGGVALGGVASEDADMGDGNWSNTDGAPFVAGLDANTGMTRWRHVLDGARGVVTSAVETSAGFTFAGAYRGGGFSFAGTGFTRPTGEDTDLMLLRVDAAGRPVWARQYGGGSDEHMLQLVADTEGHLTLSLSARGAVDLGGETLTAPSGPGNRGQVFVAAYDDAGLHVWSRQVPNLGATDIAGHALLAQPGGDVVMVTSLAGPAELDGRTLTPVAGEDLVLLQLRR